MKTKISYSLLAAAMACGIAQGAATAYTTPVGYTTSSLFGNVSGSSSGAGTLIAPTLVNPAVFAGATSVAPAGSVATFASGVPTDLNGTYVLEITSGPSAGFWSTVVSSTATSVTIFDAFPLGLATGTTVSVRKFNTISSVFGATNSANIGASDFIEILDPLTQATTSIVYAGGWFDLGTEAPAGDYVIHPGTAVRVIVKGASPLTLVTSGEVKVTKSDVDFYVGEAWVAQTFASGGTFGALDLANKVLPTDEVVLYGADSGSGQPADSFVASGGTMFNLSTEADSTGVLIPDSSGMIVKRASGSNTTATFPAQPVAP